MLGTQWLWMSVTGVIYILCTPTNTSAATRHRSARGHDGHRGTVGAHEPELSRGRAPALRFCGHPPGAYQPATGEQRAYFRACKQALGGLSACVFFLLAGWAERPTGGCAKGRKRGYKAEVCNTNVLPIFLSLPSCSCHTLQRNDKLNKPRLLTQC